MCGVDFNLLRKFSNGYKINKNKKIIIIKYNVNFVIRFLYVNICMQVEIYIKVIIVFQLDNSFLYGMYGEESIVVIFDLSCIK